MAEHRRQRMRIQPFHEMQIGMTEPGDRGADQDLARSGLLQADVLDHQRLVDFVQDGGLHRILPYFVGLLTCCGRRAYADDEQFANLGHADGTLAQQMIGNRALRRIFREPERIVPV